MDAVLSVATVTVVGLMVGVELSVALVINPILRSLPFGSMIAGRAYGARMLGRLMPFWYIGSMLLGGALAVLTWGTATAIASLVGAVLLAISVLMSVLWLVPINDRAKHWTEEDHPADWRDLQQRWDALHYVRVAVIVGALVAVAVAATLL